MAPAEYIAPPKPATNVYAKNLKKIPFPGASKKPSDEQVEQITNKFLKSFEDAVNSQDAEAFLNLFMKDGSWRDVLAFTNDNRALSYNNIKAAAANRFPKVGTISDVKLSEPAPAYIEMFEDYSYIQIVFKFCTKIANCTAVARLCGPDWKVYTFYTEVSTFKDFPEQINENRPRGKHNTPNSYDTNRQLDRENVEPSVIIVGAGHNGLQLATRLKAMGVTSLVVDRQKRLGDSWRTRYQSLSLHDPVHANHFSYMNFPPQWPTFTPAGKMANWIEYYADIMELNVWLETTTVPEETYFDEDEQKWHVTLLLCDGSKKTFVVTHVVLATGSAGGLAKMPPPFPGQEKFTKKIVHTTQHQSGSQWKDKSALVVGACTSGHDISLDLINTGASEVTMLQRSPTFVMSVRNGIRILFDGLYSENAPPTEVADLLFMSHPNKVIRKIHQRKIVDVQEADKEVLEGLDRAGFQHYPGPEGTGYIYLFMSRYGGYYLNTGASEAIARGDIKVKNTEIEKFDEDKVYLKDGTVLNPDLVVFATGNTGIEDVIKYSIGPEHLDKFGGVWGVDEEGELIGVSKPTGIPNAYFLMGNFMLARPNSKLAALNIVADQNKLFDERYTIAVQKAAGDYIS